MVNIKTVSGYMTENVEFPFPNPNILVECDQGAPYDVLVTSSTLYVYLAVIYVNKLFFFGTFLHCTHTWYQACVQCLAKKNLACELLFLSLFL